MALLATRNKSQISNDEAEFGGKGFQRIKVPISTGTKTAATVMI